MPRALAAFLPTLLLTLLLATPAAAQSIADLVRDLGDSDYKTRLAARNALLARKDPAAIVPLGAALPGYDTLGRSYAQGVLGALPPEKTRGLWRSLLRSDDAELRAMAAAALYAQRDPAGVAVAARDVLDTELPPNVAALVLTRLSLLRHPTLMAAVRTRLESPAPLAVMRGLFRHVYSYRDPRAVPVLTTLAGSEDLQVRLRARALLYVLGRTDVAADLGSDLRDPKADYAALVDVLPWLQAGPTPPEPLKAALLERLKVTDHAASMCRILGILTRWRHRPALEVAEKLLDHEDATVARAAFGLVAELAGKAQLETLRKSLASTSPSVRVAAAEALRRFGDDSGLQPVLDVLKEGTVTERREAVKVLGGFRVRGAIPRLIDALEDPDASVRVYAWTGVRQVIVALFPYRRLDWVGMGVPYNAPEAERKRVAALLREWWVVFSSR